MMRSQWMMSYRHRHNTEVKETLLQYSVLGSTAIGNFAPRPSCSNL